jgi:exoribonuclease-2
MFSVMGAQGLARGAHVRVKLGEIDLMALDVSGTVIAHLDADNPQDSDAEEAEEDDALPAGPVSIAVDLHDSTQSHEN